MSDPNTPKDDTFLRKVARFVANPATDWADLSASPDENRELELEKSELKAMVERKRRNDFVRRREFDMLRRVRREGLSPEQLAALGSSSRLDDTDRGLETQPGHRSGNVKAKIDAIEKQMVGTGTRPVPLNAPAGHNEATISTSPAVMERDMNHARPPVHVDEGEEDLLPALPPLPPDEGEADLLPPPPPKISAAPTVVAPAMTPQAKAVPLPSLSLQTPPAQTSAGAPRANPPAATMPKGAGLPPLTPPSRGSRYGSLLEGAVEVGEVAHDPELDPAVIAFANADFDDCERMLGQLTKKGAARAQHAETWLVLFDFYRATGQQSKFETLALEYAQQFGSSAPQWYSLPKLVAEAAAADTPKRSRARGDIGWVCPDVLDSEAFARLASTTLQLPMPWVLDWTALRSVDAQAAGELSTLLRHWANLPLEMRWIQGERLFEVLGDTAPPGARDADPAYWMVRLDALRLANRPDQFDEMAIEYCITYEVSPPSWEPARAIARLGTSDVSTQSPSLMQITSSSHTSLLGTQDGPEAQDLATLDLSGQLVGDISSTLARLNDEIGDATHVKVACTRLIRVDFIAAGDLLNWVVTKRQQGRAVTLTETHRLVALFFGAMGINEHAGVRVRIN